MAARHHVAEAHVPHCAVSDDHSREDLQRILDAATSESSQQRF